MIFSCIASLCAEKSKPTAQQNQTLVQEYKDTIKGLVDDQLVAIDSLKTRATAATDSLAAFQEDCKRDQTALNAKQDQVTKKINDSGLDITTLQNQIDSFRQTIIDDQAEVWTYFPCLSFVG
jgi:hypothetical protein